MRSRGFTLIELVLAIVLTGALFATVSLFIVGPTTAYADMTRRAALVDAADIALRHLARDIRAAIPNSVRVHPSGLAIELAAAASGGRYRAAPDPSQTESDPLAFDSEDASFDLLGGFPGIGLPFNSAGHRLVVYNLGTPGSDLFESGSSNITPSGAGFTIDANGKVTLDAGHRFPRASPRQRIYLFDGVIRYTCDPVSGVLTRQASLPTSPDITYTPGAGDLVVNGVTDCEFTYALGSASRSAVVTLRIDITSGDESIRLLRQVHVENLP